MRNQRGAIVSKPLVGELVESAEKIEKVDKGTGAIELLLAPKEGTTVGEITFAGSEYSLKGDKAVLAGNILAETLSRKLKRKRTNRGSPKPANRSTRPAPANSRLPRSNSPGKPPPSKAKPK
jgi:hypothetical protein